jgi:hypothetical protein
LLANAAVASATSSRFSVIPKLENTMYVARLASVLSPCSNVYVLRGLATWFATISHVRAHASVGAERSSVRFSSDPSATLA